MSLTANSARLCAARRTRWTPFTRSARGEIDDTLKQGIADCIAARELIKVKVLENSEYSAREAADILCEALDCECVQVMAANSCCSSRRKRKAPTPPCWQNETLLYGGTFDPPHNGHMNNLRAALALVQPDRALVMPAGTPPHKHASATPAELRLQMCACFTALSPAVQVSDWEIRRGGRSYTVHTLEWLRGQDPDGALYLCVGSDMLLTFQKWYRWQDMLKMAALVVESRTGTDEAALHAAAAELKKAGAASFLPAPRATPARRATSAAGRSRGSSGRRCCRRRCWQ